MEFLPKRKKVHPKSKQQPERPKEECVDHDLNLYLDPPSEEVTLLECEELVAERLKVLQIVESLKERHKFMSVPFRAAFEKQVGEVQPFYTGFYASGKKEYLRRRDVISHFLLRLACSMSVDLTQRFITLELDLFKIRFAKEGQKSVTQLLASNKIKIEEVGEDEKNKFDQELMNGNRITDDKFEITKFYKLRFTDCRELVRTRRVFLHEGYCYTTSDDLIQFLAQKFRLVLSTSMNKQRTQLSLLDEDDRLLPMLHRLVYEGSQSNQTTNPNGRIILPEQVDELARTSFPLCMRTIHGRLRSEHHLKFFARQQYGLFLKGAGLTMDGSVAFFRQEFTKRMDIDKFAKSYVYNIRHMYGQEGNKTDHKPLSCPSIILNNPPGQTDCHGCPYRHSDPKSLEQRLLGLQISKERVEKIVQMTKEHRYDMACTRAFEYTHDMLEGDLGQVITNPNQYFDLSRRIKEDGR